MRGSSGSVRILKRRANAAMYGQLLGQTDQVTPQTIQQENTAICNQYLIRPQRRDELKKYLDAKNIGTEIYYPLDSHEQACFADLEYHNDDFPEAHRTQFLGT